MCSVYCIQYTALWSCCQLNLEHSLTVRWSPACRQTGALPAELLPQKDRSRIGCDVLSHERWKASIHRKRRTWTGDRKEYATQQPGLPGFVTPYWVAFADVSAQTVPLRTFMLSWAPVPVRVARAWQGPAAGQGVSAIVNVQLVDAGTTPAPGTSMSSCPICGVLAYCVLFPTDTR